MERKLAYRDCLLNTCIRMARDACPELSLINCMNNQDFKEKAARWLCFPFFTVPIEQAMETARVELIRMLLS